MCISKITTDDFIKKAKEIHGDKYDYSKVVYVKTKTKVDIICKVEGHGVFSQSPNKHLQNRGCPKCSHSYHTTQEEFIEKCVKKHGNLYDYSLVEYVNAESIIKIICPIHGEFEQKAKTHLNRKCGKCRIENLKITEEEFNQRLDIMFVEHGGRKHITFDGSGVFNLKTKIQFKCVNSHKEWFGSPKSLLLLQKCPCCDVNIIKYKKIKQVKTEIVKVEKKVKTVKEQKSKKLHTKHTTESFIKKAKEIHGDRYDYSKLIYINATTKVEIICEEHGSFFQNPMNHTHLLNGCPNCSFVSKGEITIKNILNKFGISYETQKNFQSMTSRFMKYDFYIPVFNLCIEYDGKQHFKPTDRFGGIIGFLKQQISDKIKNNYCKDNNIDLLRIPYWDFKNIEQILLNKFKQYE